MKIALKLFCSVFTNIEEYQYREVKDESILEA